MHRLCSLAALTIVVLGTSLLLRAQPNPPANDPFGAAPPAHAGNIAADPFAPPQPAPAQAASKAKAENPPVGKNWLVDLVVPPCEIIFADESLGKEVLKKMTPAERMAYHLDRTATIKIYPDTVTLRDLVPVLSKQLQVNVEIDRVPLVESAFDFDCLIDFQMTYPANLGASLHRLLHGLGLDYVRLDDTLLITTRIHFQDKLFVKTYSLDREMFRPKTAAKYKVEVHAQVAGGAGGALAPGSQLSLQGGFVSGNSGDEDALVDIIQLIQPESWVAHGGIGKLHLDLKRSLLVVNHRQDIHDEIEVLLADLRKVARSNQQAIQANAQLERRVVFRLKLPEKQAGKPQPFGDGLGGNFIPLEPAFTMKEVAELIKQQVEPHSWKDEKHTITILGENLIINQSEAVQTKIHQFLNELGITRQQHDENNRPFYGLS